jgi:hypothetical protein
MSTLSRSPNPSLMLSLLTNQMASAKSFLSHFGSPPVQVTVLFQLLCNYLTTPFPGVIILRSIVVGYPVATAADASLFDDGSSSPTIFHYSAEPQTQ